MKNIILTLILAFTFIVSKATEKEIKATVVFENLTNEEQVVGEFFIMETNQKITVTGTESFEITLPGKGKYQFEFTSKQFAAYTFYPSKITKRRNTITVRLMNKSDMNNGGIYSIPLELDINLTDEQIERRIADGNLNFIVHGMDSSIPKEYVEFKEKYGVGLIKENCVIDPLSFKRATENNQMISDYLNKKYEEKWLKELPTKSFGFK